MSSYATSCFLMQVLTSLQPLDYIVVAFLPGISEVSIEDVASLHTFPKSIQN